MFPVIPKTHTFVSFKNIPLFDSILVVLHCYMIQKQNTNFIDTTFIVTLLDYFVVVLNYV